MQEAAESQRPIDERAGPLDASGFEGPGSASPEGESDQIEAEVPQVGFWGRRFDDPVPGLPELNPAPDAQIDAPELETEPEPEALPEVESEPQPRERPPTAAEARLGSEGLARLRARYAEILARISERGGDEEAKGELKLRAERLNPDAWVTETEVRDALELYETVVESLRAVVGHRRRGRRRRQNETS